MKSLRRKDMGHLRLGDGVGRGSKDGGIFVAELSVDTVQGLGGRLVVLQYQSTDSAAGNKKKEAMR